MDGAMTHNPFLTISVAVLLVIATAGVGFGLAVMADQFRACRNLGLGPVHCLIEMAR
jgi:hypothetical protein